LAIQDISKGTQNLSGSREVRKGEVTVELGALSRQQPTEGAAKQRLRYKQKNKGGWSPEKKLIPEKKWQGAQEKEKVANGSRYFKGPTKIEKCKRDQALPGPTFCQGFAFKEIRPQWKRWGYLLIANGEE